MNGSLYFPDAEDVVETCHNCLDDLWKLDAAIYPQRRMVHLMDIIAHAITRSVHVANMFLRPFKRRLHEYLGT